MKKQGILLILCVGFVIICWSQSPALPSILPASPEPTALAKAGNIDVSLSSGMATASIPLYEMKIGKYSLPLSVNYGANGLKVDEVPSRVGIGWTLSAGGVITRIVRGKPDDKSTQHAYPAPTPSLHEVVDYYDNIVGNTDWDNQPDEYSISAPGLNGKFIVDSTGNVIKFPFSNNKIEVTSSSTELKVKITDVNGVIYYFGYDNKVEKTVSHNVQGPVLGHQAVITALYLTKMEYPNGDFVNFNYSSINYSVNPGVTQNYGAAMLSNLTTYCHCSGGFPPTQCSSGSGFSSTALDVQYNSFYLTSIHTCDSQYVNFGYEDRPDGSEDRRLTSIGISAGDFSKGYHFTYYDPSVSSSAYSNSNGLNNKMFFLKEIYWLDMVPEISTDTIRYSFSYETLDQLPARLNYGQDHFGYYNGASNYYLLPYSPNTSEVNWGSTYASADRNPHWNYSKIGMLTKITYPTGGLQEFDYEANQFAKNEKQNTINTLSVTGSGNTSGGGSYQTLTYYSYTFDIHRNQTANVSISVFANPGCSSCTPPPPNTLDIAWLDIVDMATGSIWTELMRDYNTNNFTISLDSGHRYDLKLRVRGLPNAAYAQITYDYSFFDTYAWANYEAPGLRVKSINNFDPVSGKDFKKRFFYTSNITGNISSGKYIFEPDYTSDSRVTQLCQSDLDPDEATGCHNYFLTGPYETTHCLFKTLQSNSAILSTNFENHILYDTVFEADDEDLVHGYTAHIYWVDPVYNSTNVMGVIIKNVPGNTVTSLNGYEKQTLFYSKNSNIQKDIRSFYSMHESYSTVLPVYAVNKQFTQPITDWGNPDIMLEPYDVTEYDYISSWIKLDSTVTVDYDSANIAMTAKTYYYYGTNSNTLPVKTKSFTSREDSLVTDMKYPNDYPSTSPYTTMVTKNIISPVVETKQKINTTDLSLVRNNFYQWSASGSSAVIEPQTVVAKKGSASEETRIHYYAYDLRGNPIEVAKENGAHISYIWDYYKTFPIAEIKNAGLTSDSIAYTSFEADNKGYWVYSGTAVTEAFAPMGNSCYSLSAGNITRAVNSAKSYFVTYWKKDTSGTATVNGSSGTSLITRNGWTCYRCLIQSTSTVTLSGTGKIDELRLYPVGSFVTTFNYRTYVGISSRDEPNNQISYYEYDASNRLRLIRDMDRNIVKQFEYAYKKQIYPCTDTAANWVSTGALRCVKTNDHYNNNTGVQEYEQRDMKNCSPTYLQKRWVGLGTNGQCPPVTCSGDDKRVINGVCTAGTKMLVGSVQISPTEWICTWHYVWSDGYVGDNFNETTSGCAIEE